MPTTAIYVRISQDTGLTRAGVKRQLADCEALCKQNQWAPAVVYEDNDASAFSGRRRPAYQRMVADIADGAVDRVVTWHPDRLHRSPRELEDFITLIETTGCEIATVREGRWDLTTVSGRLTARVVGNVSVAESEHKSERIKRKMVDLAAAGVWNGGGIRPFGYTKVVVDGRTTLAINQAEADEIVDMVARYLAGQSARSIAAGLTERGVPTVNGGQWRTNTVQGIVTSPTIAGQRVHHGQVVGPGTWPAIITPEESAAARAITSRRWKRSPGREREHLLTGLCRCGRCDGRLYAGQSDHRQVMRCAPPPNGCGRLSMLRHPLEDLIVEAVFAAVDDTRLPRIERGPTRTTVDDAETQLAELAAAYADRLISMGEWRIARDRIQTRVNTAVEDDADQRSRQAAIRPFTKRGALAAAWPTLPVGQQRAILQALIDTIVIAPATKGRVFDADRVDIRWRS